MYNRFKVFKDNAKHVFKMNVMKKSLKLKLNQFADMFDDEFRKMYTSIIPYNKDLYVRK